MSDRFDDIDWENLSDSELSMILGRLLDEELDEALLPSEEEARLLEESRQASLRILDEFSKAKVWNQVNAWLFTGGEIHQNSRGGFGHVFGYSPQDMLAEGRNLVEAGVTHVIDCRGEANEKATRKWWKKNFPQIGYFYAGTGDNGLTKPKSYFAKVLIWVIEVLGENPDAKFYAHCQCGINRGPSMAAMLLMAFGYSLEDARDAIRSARPCAAIDYLADAYNALDEMGVIGAYETA